MTYDPWNDGFWTGFISGVIAACFVIVGGLAAAWFAL